MSIPTFAELNQISINQQANTRLSIKFQHGEFAFQGRITDELADIGVDFWQQKAHQALPLLNFVRLFIEREFRSYSQSNTQNIQKSLFSSPRLRIFVSIEDADSWISYLYRIIADKNNFPGSKSFDKSNPNFYYSPLGETHREDLPDYVESDDEIISTAEKKSETHIRIGQDRFRDAVLNNYQIKCCFPDCPVDDAFLLVASHIDRWCDNDSVRGEVSNGLCLCGNHDKAFENGLFTLTEDFEIEYCGKSLSKWANQYIKSANGMRILLGKIKPSINSIGQHRKRSGM